MIFLKDVFETVNFFFQYLQMTKNTCKINLVTMYAVLTDDHNVMFNM